ncbi:hypothetical protein [Rhodobacteraceae bacterium DSL-40]|uniref:hypothetical protein n=1 Tax=Amaricoccus sp. B4 TaxID=3368557 RepID=UPI000DAD259A
MRLIQTVLICGSLAIMAGCTTEEFTTAYTNAALAPSGPTPEQQMDSDIRRAGQEAVDGVDTSDFGALE